VASAFATFYEKCPVLKAPSQEVTENRLLLCQLAGQTLATGMNLLGITARDQLSHAVGVVGLSIEAALG